MWAGCDVEYEVYDLMKSSWARPGSMLPQSSCYDTQFPVIGRAHWQPNLLNAFGPRWNNVTGYGCWGLEAWQLWILFVSAKRIKRVYFLCQLLLQINVVDLGIVEIQSHLCCKRKKSKTYKPVKAAIHALGDENFQFNTQPAAQLFVTYSDLDEQGTTNTTKEDSVIEMAVED